MTIEFECPKCGKEYRVKDAMAGRKVKCKTCGGNLDVPESEYDDDEWDDDQVELSRPAPRKRLKSGGQSKNNSSAKTNPPSAGKRIFAVIGMAVGVLILGGATVALINGNTRAIRGIGTGVVVLAVSFGWFKGTSG